MENTYPQFKKDQAVVDCYGRTGKVLFQRGCQVFVYAGLSGWYHPTKIFPVKK